MKSLVLFSFIALWFGSAFATKVIVTNTGFTFTPDSISIKSNDTVVFQLESIHNVVEVSADTWSANGNTPLPGFSLPFGGGELSGLTAGIHYYVCSPHASLGMKGRIFVTSGLGIAPPETGNPKVSVSPNPTTGKFSVLYQAAGSAGDIRVDVYNLLGVKIWSQPDLQRLVPCEMDIAAFPDGIYFLRIVDGLKTSTVRILKR